MPTEYTISKSPNAILNYGFNWDDWLGNNTITASTWVIDGLTIDTNSFTDTVTTALISGGKVGHSYHAVNTITVSTGEAESRTLHINVISR